jgi:hypothetical protein
MEQSCPWLMGTQLEASQSQQVLLCCEHAPFGCLVGLANQDKSVTSSRSQE